MRDNLTKAPDFYVGDIAIYGDLVLAPMDGYSDLPFRSICKQLGSAMSYSEFVNVDNITGSHHESNRAKQKLTFDNNERPMCFQIYGHNIDNVVKTAIELQKKQPDIIDINMGCYIKKISERGAGAGMLKFPERIYQLFSRLNEELDIPATGKIRLGWDDEALEKKAYLEAADALASAGGKLLAVHGRTRKQGYKGDANWDAIAEICQSIKSIPVLANGDVTSVEDIAKIKQHTQCDGVMIGRGAIGNPWIFQHRDTDSITKQEKLTIALKHLQLNIKFYGEEIGIRNFRKHSKQYIGDAKELHSLRQKLVTSENFDEIKNLYNDYFHFQLQAVL